MLWAIEEPYSSLPVFDLGLVDGSLQDLLLAPFEPFERSMAGHGMDTAGARRGLIAQGRLWTVPSHDGPLHLVIVDRAEVDDEGWEITVVPRGVAVGQFIAKRLGAILQQDA